MKIILKLALIVTFAHSFITVQAQKSKVQSIEDEYETYSYVKTSEVLLEVAENGFKNQDVLQKLANSFYFLNNMKEATRWYDELFSMAKDNNINIDSEYYFRYALALKGVEQYVESDKFMKKFAELNPNDSRSGFYNSRTDYLSTIESLSSNLIAVENLEFNSKYSDFGTAFYDDDMIFASARGEKNSKTYQWNNQPFLDIYKVHKYDDGKFSKPIAFGKKVNTKMHESSVAFTKDSLTMYFTRNNFYKKRARKDGIGVNRLKIFRATKNDKGQWDDVEPVHFNSDEYSVAHPTINPDGTRMYFSSDMDGTIGESDIFVVDINADGSLGVPVNLGGSINTSTQDSFPFMNESGDLYYSTIGLPGLGGFDIFVSKGLDAKIASGIFYDFVVTNVGKPINSNKDDLAYFRKEGTDEGYFTSNRDGGKGDDDIYRFFPIECNQSINGVVTDSKTKELLPGSVVILFDDSGKELERVTVGKDAKYTFDADCDTRYLIRGTKEKYSADEVRFTTTTAETDLEIDINLDKDEVEINPCDDLAKALSISLVYFDLDKYDIKYEAEVELQKILTVLNKYPTMTLDIRSHTDCRASDDYNQVLSDNRAKATRQYLINGGIDASRLTAKGYGETQLVNNCGCNSNKKSSCTELQHQQNRRSEFIIKSIKGKKCDE